MDVGGGGGERLESGKSDIVKQWQPASEQSGVPT